MPSSLTPQLPSRLPSFSSTAATSMVVTESTKQLARQVAVYLVVTLGIVMSYSDPPCRRLFYPLILFSLSIVVTAVISGTILLIWNDDWTALILRRLKLESLRSGRFIMKT
jgi:hypothetical protein